MRRSTALANPERFSGGWQNLEVGVWNIGEFQFNFETPERFGIIQTRIARRGLPRTNVFRSEAGHCLKDPRPWRAEIGRVFF